MHLIGHSEGARGILFTACASWIRAGSPAATSRTSAPLNVLIYLELYLPQSQRESLKTPLPLLLLSLLTKRLAVHKESVH